VSAWNPTASPVRFRPWWRLHRSTWALLVLLAGLIVLLNWPVEYTEDWQGDLDGLGWIQG
jgi:hypothetical protein